jgi:ketosteroid isomerase-like protein
MSEEERVRKASEQFYSALSNMTSGDAKALNDVWSHSQSVTTMHPIGGQETGWDKVQRSWQKVSEVSKHGKVRLTNQVINVSGDMAYELGVEQGSMELGGKQINIDHRVTNIYRLENGNWKIVHHHCDVAPAMVEALKGLKVPA